MPRPRHLAFLALLALVTTFGFGLGYSAQIPTSTPGRTEPPPAPTTDLPKAPPLPANPQPQIAANYGSLPLYFIANQGQVDKRANITLRAAGRLPFSPKMK
jgi:hypothetical protein